MFNLLAGISYLQVPRWRSFHRLYVIHKIAFFICELLMLAQLQIHKNLYSIISPFQDGAMQKHQPCGFKSDIFFRFKISQRAKSPPVLFLVAPLCYLIFFRRNCHFEVKVRFYSNTGIQSYTDYIVNDETYSLDKLPTTRENFKITLTQ